MKLLEFFGKPVDINKEMSKDREDSKLGDDLFWFIVDHDRLHKDFFHPIAVKIHRAQKANKLDKAEIVKDFMPMVIKGSKEFFRKNKMLGNIKETFPKELRKDVCEKLFDHYREDIIKGKYKIGI
jgi:hypothetical protein